ncbi:MAG: glycosyltransferase family 39 protein [Candidatus Magasanikbacteria bacterium]|nr:glycosyltransferase family 39 protein [Candidatus Magasanikbacteria bacterium]
MNFISNNKILVVIIGASFLLSLGYSFWYRIPPLVDAGAYDAIAVNITDGFGFREVRTRSYQFDPSIIRAGPGYEFFLAGLYVVFGHRYEPVWVLQAILHALSALLLFLICRKIFPEQGGVIGLFAAGLFGLHPDLIEISAMLMTETLYLFLIILALWFFAEIVFGKKSSWWQSIIFGMVTSVAILTRPPVVLFVPGIIAVLLYQKKYRTAWFFLLGLAAAFSPWVVRNYFVYHQFILTTLVGSYNLWVGNTLLSIGGQISGGPNPVDAYTSVYGFFDLKSKASREFFVFIFGYPLVFLKLCALRFIRFFSLIRPMGFWFYQSGLGQVVFVASSALSQAVLFITGFSGSLLALREKKIFYTLLVILAFTSPLVLLPTVVESRYRFQIYPFLAIFGGYYLLAFLRKDIGRWKIGGAVVAGLILISLADAFVYWPTVVGHLRLLF